MTGVMVRTGAVATTGVAASADRRLLNNDLAMSAVQPHRNKRSPEEEHRLHNADREGSLEHRAGLVDIQRKRVICALAV